MEIGVELGKEPKNIGGRERGNKEKKTLSVPSLPTLTGSVPMCSVSVGMIRLVNSKDFIPFYLWDFFYIF